MGSQLANFSIVIVGQTHNPSILNPDFLAIRGIVPSDWSWELASPPIVTPPLAVVEFKSGVSVTVDTSKLQVLDAGPDRYPKTSRIPLIAERYVSTLPHVRYTGVGINFSYILERSDPDQYLRERFLRNNEWEPSGATLAGFAARFIYRMQDAVVTVSTESATADPVKPRLDLPDRGVLVSANFHREIRQYPADSAVIECVRNFQSDWEAFESLAGALVEEASLV